MIRGAEVNDANSISALCSQLGHPIEPGVLAEQLLFFKQHPQEHGVFVACNADGSLLGWVHVRIEWHLHLPRRAQKVFGKKLSPDAATSGTA